MARGKRLAGTARPLYQKYRREPGKLDCPDGSPVTEETTDRWLQTTDAVLRGIAHHLSNRTGTIGAVAEALIAAKPDDPLVAALAREAAELDLTLRALRLMSLEPGREAEPVRPADLLADARRLLAMHGDARDAVVDTGALDAAPPVRVRVGPAVHALLVALVAAAGRDGAPVTVRADALPGATRLTIGGAGLLDPTVRSATEASVSRLIANDGGRALAADDARLLVELPGLQRGPERNG